MAGVPASRSWGGADAVAGCVLPGLASVTAEATCTAVDALFRGEPSQPCVAVLDAGRIGLVMRERFAQIMTGPFGYGRALWADRPVRDVADWQPLVVPARMPLLEVAQRLRQRHPERRYDDLIVDFGDGVLGRVSAAEILDALARRLSEQASRDALTAVASRCHFLDQLAAACTDAGRSGSRVLVAFVDIDRMKRINDTRGRNVGDAVLVSVARQLVSAAGDEALVGRLGDDEFAVLRPVPSGASGAAFGHVVGERLRQVVTRRDPRLPPGVRVRASVGVAVTGPIVDADTLLREADMALFTAKQAGGDTTVVAAEVGAQLGQVADTATRDVLEAVAGGELRMVYQPIVRIADGTLVAVEALVRWQHPRLGLLTPDRFLPGAEHAGYLPSIDRWVLATASADLSHWISRLGSAAPERIHINISVAALAEPGFDRLVLDTLVRAGVTPDRIRIELPESADLSALLDARPRLERLSGHGVAIALDDMGAGASTLRHLSLPSITEMKIDQSFVAGMLDNDRDHAVVRLLADLGRSLGLGVTAEGVEDADQLTELDRLGVGYAQGYHIDRPQSAQQLLDALAVGRPARWWQ